MDSHDPRILVAPVMGVMRARRGRRALLSRVGGSVGVVLVLAAVSLPNDVIAADVDCPTASEQGQKLRDQGKLIRAREMFLLCSKATCPSVVRKDCAKWLPELEESVPTIVFSAQDGSGNDLSAVAVTVDGAKVATVLDGKPVPIDPGPHTVIYDAPGAPPLTQNVIIRAGEKNRIVKATLGAPPAKPDPSPDPKPDPKPGSRPEQRPQKSGVPVLTYVLGGVGVIGIGSFAFFGVTGKSDLDNLKSTCAPSCDPAKLDDAKTKLVIADISLGVGVLALGGAAIVFLTSGGDNKPAKTGLGSGINARIDATPLPGGGAASLSGSF